MENHNNSVQSHEGRSHFHFSITMIKQNSSSNSKSREEKQNTTYKEHYVGFVYIHIAIIIVNTLLFPVDFCHTTTDH